MIEMINYCGCQCDCQLWIAQIKQRDESSLWTSASFIYHSRSEQMSMLTKYFESSAFCASIRRARLTFQENAKPKRRRKEERQFMDIRVRRRSLKKKEKAGESEQREESELHNSCEVPKKSICGIQWTDSIEPVAVCECIYCLLLFLVCEESSPSDAIVSPARQCDWSFMF